MPLLNSLLRDKGGAPVGAFQPERPQVIDTESDHSLKYFFIFLFLGGGCAIWTSYQVLAFNLDPTSVRLLNVGVVLMIFLALSALQLVMIASSQLNLLLIMLETATVLSLFYIPFSGWFLIGGALCVAFWFFSFRHARNLLTDGMQIRLWPSASILLSGMITGLAFLLASLYVGLYQQAGGITLESYKFIVSGASPGLEYVVPNFNPDTNVDALLTGAVSNYIKKATDSGKLPAGLPDSVVRDSVSGLKEKLVGLTGLSIDPGESFIDYSFRYVTTGLKELQNKGLGWLVIGSILVVIFFSIKGVLFLLKWPVLICVLLIYQLLKSINVVSVGVEMRQKEVIIVK